MSAALQHGTVASADVCRHQGIGDHTASVQRRRLLATLAGFSILEALVTPEALANNKREPARDELNLSGTITKRRAAEGKRVVAGIRWSWPTFGSFIIEDSGFRLYIFGDRGTPVTATADGEVVHAGSGLRGYGNLVVLRHGPDYLSAYAHNDRLVAKEKAKVKRGQIIATRGSTESEQVTLLLEVRYRGKRIQPMTVLPRSRSLLGY